MNLDELRHHFTIAYRMIAEERERRQRQQGSDEEKQYLLAECDQALASLVAIKDELKARIAPAIQETLIDVPEGRKGGY